MTSERDQGAPAARANDSVPVREDEDARDPYDDAGGEAIEALDAELDALLLDVPGDEGLTRWPAGLEDALDVVHEARAALLALREADGAERAA